MKIHEVFVYLTVPDAKAAVEFYQEAFGVEEIFRLVDPGDGRIGHVELRFGPSIVMLADEYPEYGISAAQSAARGFRIHLHVDNADAAIERAVQAGATLV